MGGAQPLAGVLAGAATLIVEVDPERVERRLREGYLQHRCDDLEGALALVLGAKERGEAISVGLVANIADVMDALLARGITPDIVTDQTDDRPDPRLRAARHDDRRVRRVARARPRRADSPRRRHARRAHPRSMLEFQRRGAEVFEYGNGLRARAQMLGVEDAFDIGGSRSATSGRSSARASARSAGSRSPAIRRTSTRSTTLILEHFEGDPITHWITAAREAVQFTGLPARIGWLGYGDRRKLGLLVNDAIASGRISGPIAFTRDHLDSGGGGLRRRARPSACATAPTASPTGRS